MRNKKIFIALFILFTFFFLISNLKAKSCEYKTSNKKVSITFELELDIDGKAGAKNAEITGIKDTFGEKVLNWSSNGSLDGITFTGKDYYTKNEKCPQYAILILTDTQKYLYVTDDSNKASIASAAKNKHPKYNSITQLSLIGSSENDDPKDPIEEIHTCLDFNDKPSCETDDKVACVWVESKGYAYCNTDKLQYVKCGDAEDIPSEAPRIISFVINFFKIAAPILLVLVGAVSLAKAIASSSEDEMEKAKKSLIKKFIYAALVFFVIAVVQFVILKAADDSEEGSINSCLSCFLNNSCGDSIYYKTTVGGIDIRTYLSGKQEL